MLTYPADRGLDIILSLYIYIYTYCFGAAKNLVRLKLHRFARAFSAHRRLHLPTAGLKLRVCVNFPIFQTKHMLWVLKRTVSMRRFF